MFKSKLFATMTIVFAVAAVLMTMSIARTAFAEGASDVFMDEGDGDFDSMPAPPPAQDAPAKKEETAVKKTAEPRPPVQEEQSEAMPMLTDEQATPSATPAPTEDPAQPADAKPKKDKKPGKKKKATASADGTGAAAKGQFVTTKDACPMMRSPASTGETMLTVKAQKKIWVEDAGDGWVKAFNKAGEPGFVSKDCVQ